MTAQWIRWAGRDSHRPGSIWHLERDPVGAPGKTACGRRPGRIIATSPPKTVDAACAKCLKQERFRLDREDRARREAVIDAELAEARQRGRFL